MKTVTKRDLSKAVAEGNMTLTIEKSNPQPGFTLNKVYADEYQIGVYSNFNKSPDYAKMIENFNKVLDYVDDLEDMEEEFEESTQVLPGTITLLDEPQSLKVVEI